MQPVIYVDLRCLQDPNYRVRGIGHHVAALLRTRRQSSLSNYRTIGLIDLQAPELPEECASWVDELTASVNPCCNSTPAVFIDGTPMTHETRFSLRFLNHPAFLKAAVVYDFIPLDWPGYLPATSIRIHYLAKLARLRKFDLFFPISDYTAWRLSELLGVPTSRISVTGASVRRSLYDLKRAAESALSRQRSVEPYFLMVSADDTRKNPEVAVKAVRYLNDLYSRRIPLKVLGHYEGKHKVLGHYGDSYKRDLLHLAGHEEGNGFLEFCPGISDEELVSLHAGALAAIAPSHIEGFSLPVVEASVCGCPVIASTCAAHLELIDQPAALFPSYDSASLSEKLAALLENPAVRDSLVSSQAHLAGNFHEQQVGERFWNAIEVRLNSTRAPAVSNSHKPRLAFLSPYPPDQSGVARFTAMTMRAGENLFNSDLYSDAPRPLTFEGNFRDAGAVSVAPIVNGQYNAVISVLGNSHFHTPIFEFFERYGGPCILHDARLIQIYVHRLGHAKFLKLAARLLGRPVELEEVHSWLQDRNPPSLFLEPIIERASPLIVNSVVQQIEIKDRYGAEAHVATCCPTTFFDTEDLTQAGKQAARNRLGIPPGAFLISSFGIVGAEKGMDTCILATELLRSWNIPAALYFVGNAGTHKGEVDRIAALYGIAEYVHAHSGFVDDATYRDSLLASDAAVQLRTYGFGQFSAALADCVSAGLACVATSDLAKSCDAPDYVLTVPDRFSPLQVAEQLALVWAAQKTRASYADLRAAYLETHNFRHYGKRLIEILGVA